MATTKAQTAPINEIEWDAVEGENTDFADRYPRMQWNHGSKQAAGFNKTGGLFIAKDQFPNFSGVGFSPVTFITRDGEEIEGYGATEAHIAVIRVKHQWIKDDNGKNVPLAHALCVVKDVPDLICLSLRGPSKALEFQKTFNQHIAQVVAVANRTKPEGRNPLEPFALWFRLSVGDLVSIPSKDGKSSSIVTPFALSAPEKIDREYVTSLWVGTDNYKSFASYWKDTKKWQTTPIWEQRSETIDDHTTPEYSGKVDENSPAQQWQVKRLVEICIAKDFDEREIMLGVSGGELENFEQLSFKQSNELFDALKAK